MTFLGTSWVVFEWRVRDTVVIRPGGSSRQLGEPLGYVSNDIIVQDVIGEMRCGVKQKAQPEPASCYFMFTADLTHVR